MTNFVVTFKVDGKVLPDLLGAIAPECQLLSVVPEEHKPIQKRTNIFTHRRKPANGSPGCEDLILAELDKFKTVPQAKLEDTLEAAGYKRHSASPRLSQLNKAGIARRNPDGTWSRIK